MNNQLNNLQTKKKYDLEERTAIFGEAVVKFCRDFSKDPISTPLLTQLIRSATSIGANYMEANGASSKKDFQNKIFICKKEAQETKHWLRMLATFDPNSKSKIDQLCNEVQQLTLIFQKITSTLREGLNK